jgi:hypothetical protein
MKDALKSGQSFDEETTGEPVEAHGYIVTPVARVRGKAGSMSDERSNGRYGWAAIRPIRAIITDRNGNTQELRIVNQDAQAVTAMAAMGLVVFVVSLVISVLLRTTRR